MLEKNLGIQKSLLIQICLKHSRLKSKSNTIILVYGKRANLTKGNLFGVAVKVVIRRKKIVKVYRCQEINEMIKIGRKRKIDVVFEFTILGE